MPYDPGTVFIDLYPNDLKTYADMETCMQTYGSFIHNCHKLKATKMSVNRWIENKTVSTILFNEKNRWAIKPCQDID